jgi:hypothetical protein
LALIAFVLPRLAQASQDIIKSPLTFARLAHSNSTRHRRVKSDIIFRIRESVTKFVQTKIPDMAGKISNKMAVFPGLY